RRGSVNRNGASSRSVPASSRPRQELQSRRRNAPSARQSQRGTPRRRSGKRRIKSNRSSTTWIESDGMTHDVTLVLATLGVLGQVVAGLLLLLGLLWLVGLRRPLVAVRGAISGYELWLAFLVAATATGGSLFFSEIAHFVPCELCWFQRVCMYPLSILTLLAALANDHRVARYLLPLPLVGSGIAVYHLLVEHGVVSETRACRISA